MNNYDKLIEVSNALQESGWETQSINFAESSLTVKRFYATVNVYVDIYEQRLSLNEENHPGCYRYLEGIKPEDMVSVILKLIQTFRHENYRLTLVNRYGQDCGHDKFEYSYFPDEKSILRRLVEASEKEIDESGETLFSLEQYEHQYPNPAMKLVVKRVRENNSIKSKYYGLKDSLMFECHHIEYKCEETDGYRKKVLDEVVRDDMYYAFVTIKDTK